MTANANTVREARLPAVPVELTGRQQWVAFRLEGDPDRPAKPKKIPYYNPYRRASTADPNTWLSYTEASALSRTNGFDGVGFVFSREDPYVGIDLDHVRDPVTDAVLPWAQRVLDALASYTELSPSGTGFHVFLRSTLGAVLKQPVEGASAIEAYSQGRYFTVTGAALDGRIEIADIAPAALEAVLAPFRKAPSVKQSNRGDSPPVQNADVDDDALLVRMGASSRDGQAYHRLFIAGDVKRDRSASDFELACLIARWVGNDSDRIERLMRRSPLADRDKWDRRDYLPRPIASALARAARAPQLLSSSASPVLPYTPAWLRCPDAAYVPPVSLTVHAKPFLTTHSPWVSRPRLRFRPMPRS
jgi:putative DNA primase/helicase